MNRKIVSYRKCCVFAVLLTVGAGIALAAPLSIPPTITLAGVTPNPGGVAQTIAGNGTYTLGSFNNVANNLKSVVFTATYTLDNVKKGTKVSKTANTNAGNWDVTMAAAAGTYSCQASISVTNPQLPGQFLTVYSNIIGNIVVK
ncbi:MAG: hypothetical protein ACYC3I_04370 [Gemmataceae bacterium]